MTRRKRVVLRLRPHGASLATRLLAIAVVPIVALSVLAIQRIDAEHVAADDASNVANVVELQQTISAVYPSAQLERIALEGLARIDELELPRQVVVAMTGMDLEELYGTNLVNLERTLDDLADGYRSLVLPDGQLLGDRLGKIRGSLETQRTLSADRRATTGEVNQVFSDLFTLFEDAMATAAPNDVRASRLDRNRVQLDALASVLVSAGTYGQSVLRSILYRTDDLTIETISTHAAHDARLDAFQATLDASELPAFLEVRAQVLPPPTDLPDPGEPELGALDPERVSLIKASSVVILGQLEYIDQLQEYSDAFHDQVTLEVEETAATARAEARQTEVLLLAIAALTVTLIGLVMWSVLAPLRRLTDRAADISRGELQLEPLPCTGPSDVRALTNTMNNMLATLHRVDDEITRLASGDTADSEMPDLPGAIGVSMRHSVQHLTEVTAQLHRSEALASAIIAQAEDAIWTVDDGGDIRTSNDAAARLTGLPMSDQIGRPVAELLSQTSGEATVLTRTDPKPRVLVARSVIDVGGERLTTVMAHDISERSRFEERLTYQALHDALTGLPNRFAVLEHLEQLIAEHAGQIAVLYLDLDGFKSVNDIQGHAVGDKVLADVADKLSRVVRNGEFVGRLGGDEFVVVTHRFAQTADLVALGHRLVREIELPVEHQGRMFSLSASVGVAIPPADTSALDMIGQADNAVYQAKRRGRGRVELFDVDMQGKLDRDAEIEFALREAVAHDELVLHLQPVTDLRTNRVAGAEALVRWMRPGHGMVPPGDFIPIAERSSVILDIERWVLMRSCERLVAWREREPGCTKRIAVNISGRHLTEGDLLADIHAVLGLTGADPSMLELELTETQLLEDMERATTVLDEIRSLGITIAVDDFGTGYSSMTYLRELPIDVIKIDRSFVSRATEHGYDSTVIEAILAIGRTLNLNVVAEGIETTDQLDYVRARGCGSAQGFLLARPMPIEDAEAVIFDLGETEIEAIAARRAVSPGRAPVN